jgi:acetolactate synthase-1/2/3 large subunit
MCLMVTNGFAFHHLRGQSMHGGDLIAEALKAQGVKFLFTLCGGHISPILVGCKQRGIRVVDVRHEATAVFAADAVARLTGIPGVAAVTAGPGATNTMTAIKNAQLAQSPLVLLGGATATALKGRGALQDIDQMALFKPHVKWAKAVRKVRDLVPALEQAFRIAQSGVPGPVFVECPVDLLYEESLVRDWYGVKTQGGRTLAERALKLYLNYHVNRLFAGADTVQLSSAVAITPPLPQASQIRQAAKKLQEAGRPVLLVGSQALLEATEATKVAAAVEQLGIPVYLSGMARGLLGKQHPLQMRHKRRQALKEADLVILAGVPCDFRLDYGQHIRRRTYLISANRSRTDLKKNRRPDLAILGDPGRFLRLLAEELPQQDRWKNWWEKLRQNDDEREKEICQQAAAPTALLNSLHLCREIENIIPTESIIVADGGDFVATASYIVSPRGPLTWLDPGVFGTLGVGAGFALGAKLCRPDAEVWILYGDGSVGYSLSEFDTFVRHHIPVIAVVGNDASWMQIAREQVEILKDDVGTVLRHTDYHAVAEGFGGKGFLLKAPEQIVEILSQARRVAAAGQPVLINAHLGRTEFRKGSISM